MTVLSPSPDGMKGTEKYNKVFLKDPAVHPNVSCLCCHKDLLFCPVILVKGNPHPPRHISENTESNVVLDCRTSNVLP